MEKSQPKFSQVDKLVSIKPNAIFGDGWISFQVNQHVSKVRKAEAKQPERLHSVTPQDRLISY